MQLTSKNQDINKVQKPPDNLGRPRKNIWQNVTPFHNKTLPQLGTEGNIPILTKSIYKKPTGTSYLMEKDWLLFP